MANNNQGIHDAITGYVNREREMIERIHWLEETVKELARRIEILEGNEDN